MSYEIEIQEIDAQPAATIRVTTTPDKIGPTLAEILPEVGQYLKRAGAQSAGAPFARYYTYDRDTVDMEGGVTVREAVGGEGRVQATELPGGTVATTRHVGPYTSLHRAWRAIRTWMAENGREESGAGWEVYVTDPGEELDSAKWETVIVCPIRLRNTERGRDSSLDISNP